MKSVKFNDINIGDLVQVPRTQFAPMRHGWNGWLFSDAKVIRKGISQKTGRRIIVVEMCIPTTTNNYKTVQKTFVADCVFQTGSLNRANRILKEDHVTTMQEFEQYLQECTGAEWIRFLVDNQYIVLPQQDQADHSVCEAVT